MSYTEIDNPELYFQTVLWSGDSNSPRTITFDGSENMQPDFIWSKKRSGADYGQIYDSVRGFGASKELVPSDTFDEGNATNSSVGLGFISSVTSDGFVLTEGNHGTSSIRSLLLNHSGSTHVGWGWAAGGSAPAITYSVKVVSDSGNKYRFDDFGTSAVTLDLQEGGTYTFDQSDSSNSGHPLRFSTTSNGTHGGGSEYTTGVTVSGTPGNSGAKTVITVGSGVATLYYYCTQHSAMGGQANTNSTFGSSNFSGSIQSTVSANTTAGFSIVSWTGTLSNATIGHGLGDTPKVFISKGRTVSQSWGVYHASVGIGSTILLDSNAAKDTDAGYYGGTSPTSTIMGVGQYHATNTNSGMIAYAFAEKKGYSKFGSYTGNGNADGTFIYTGFKPAWVMFKRTDGSYNWVIMDNKRDNFNVATKLLLPNSSSAEIGLPTNLSTDFLSNGFKLRSDSSANPSTNQGSIIYMAFAESPFVNSAGAVPNNAR